MSLCPDCVTAASDRFGIGPGWRDRPCCQAREVACHPRKRMAAAYKAATGGMDETTAAWLKARAYELIRSKGRA